MRGLWIGVVTLGLSACGPKDVRVYDNSLFELGAGFNARMVCTCLFVHGRSEEACRDWTRVQPDLARFRVDEENKRVVSKVLGGGRTVAQLVDPQLGCQYVEE